MVSACMRGCPVMIGEMIWIGRWHGCGGGRRGLFARWSVSRPRSVGDERGAYDWNRGRWSLDASWKITPEPAPDLEELRRDRVLGVDLDDGHLAACVLDASGNGQARPPAAHHTTTVP